MRSAFPKLFNIGSVDIPNFFASPIAVSEVDVPGDTVEHHIIEVTEKVDGSQFSFGKIDGELQCRSKGKEQDVHSPDKMFQAACDYIVSIQDTIPEGWWFYCEYLSKPKHSTLTYDRIPKNHLVLFGAIDPDGYFVSDWDLMQDIAVQLEIDLIPRLYVGSITDPSQISEFLQRESYLGGQKVEGVVLKRYEPWLYGSQAIPLMGLKYVSEAFKEVHRESWKSENTEGGKWQAFKEGHKTTARWDKAIMHLQERGELEGTPRDIPKVIKEIRADLETEERANIEAFLWKMYGNDLLSFAAHGAAEYYKKKLMEGAFGDQEAS